LRGDDGSDCDCRMAAFRALFVCVGTRCRRMAIAAAKTMLAGSMGDCGRGEGESRSGAGRLGLVGVCSSLSFSLLLNRL